MNQRDRRHPAIDGPEAILVDHQPRDAAFRLHVGSRRDDHRLFPLGGNMAGKVHATRRRIVEIIEHAAAGNVQTIGDFIRTATLRPQFVGDRMPSCSCSSRHLASLPHGPKLHWTRRHVAAPLFELVDLAALSRIGLKTPFPAVMMLSTERLQVGSVEASLRSVSNRDDVVDDVSDTRPSPSIAFRTERILAEEDRLQRIPSTVIAPLMSAAPEAIDSLIALDPRRLQAPEKRDFNHRNDLQPKFSTYRM